MRMFLPRKSNFAMTLASARPKAPLSRPQREVDRRTRVVVAQGRQIGPEAFGERLREHVDERQYDEQAEEANRDRDDRKAHRRRVLTRVGLAGPRHRAGGRRAGFQFRDWQDRHARFPARVSDQRCSALMRNNSRNDAISITAAIAVASA